MGPFSILSKLRISQVPKGSVRTVGGRPIRRPRRKNEHLTCTSLNSSLKVHKKGTHWSLVSDVLPIGVKWLGDKGLGTLPMLIFAFRRGAGPGRNACRPLAACFWYCSMVSSHERRSVRPHVDVIWSKCCRCTAHRYYCEGLVGNPCSVGLQRSGGEGESSHSMTREIS